MSSDRIYPEELPFAPFGLVGRGLDAYRGRRVLMLQGPIGPYFARLARDLRGAGAHVVKIDFNAGDRLFSHRASFDSVEAYRGTMTSWPKVFERLVTLHDIDVVLLFGDSRPVHVPAIKAAHRMGLDIGVFEEGYLRPDYITVERNGANKHSPLPRDPAYYRGLAVQGSTPAVALGSTFGPAAMWGMLYYTAASLGWRQFPFHEYHRALGWRECRYWMRSGWRKLRYRITERRTEARFIGSNPARFFLVALQTRGDAQVRIHSPFQTVERFIEHVMRNFAEHAPPNVELVLKHHPLDRGYSDYLRLIEHLAGELGICARCHYLHDQHLPTLLGRCEGLVTINSTVGLSAVGEGVPVAVCGDSIYDIPGLTYQGQLADFWHEAPRFRPDSALWTAFREVLVSTTQVNGSFYRRHPGAGNASGVFWDKHRQAEPRADAPVTTRLRLWSQTRSGKVPELAKYYPPDASQLATAPDTTRPQKPLNLPQ